MVSFAAGSFNYGGGNMDRNDIRQVIKGIKEADYRAWLVIAVIVLLLVLAYSLGKYSSTVAAMDYCNKFWQEKIAKCICLSP